MSNRIITRISKRLRILYAALFTSWHEHACLHADCTSRWFCQGDACGMWPESECATCERAEFEQFIITQARRKAWKVGA